MCRHLALVAIDGATDEVAATLTPGFRLHLDGIDSDQAGYFSLIDANRAAHAGLPPLDVVRIHGSHQFVTALLEPRCLAHYRFEGDLIAELWMTIDWTTWQHWLHTQTLT